MDFPLFSAITMPKSVQYQSSAIIPYNSSVHPHNMQEGSIPQTYAMGYPSAKIPIVSHAASSAPQSLHGVEELYHPIDVHSHHMVKSESASPVQRAPIYSDVSYATNCKKSACELAEATNLAFTTDVDTLMKAIQAKQTDSMQKQEVTKVSPNEKSLPWSSFRTDPYQLKARETLPVQHLSP
jgi:hypothetical protein